MTPETGRKPSPHRGEGFFIVGTGDDWVMIEKGRKQGVMRVEPGAALSEGGGSPCEEHGP